MPSTGNVTARSRTRFWKALLHFGHLGCPADPRRTLEVQHIHMYRVLDGKIAEHFANRDDVGMMRQLGLLPPPPWLSGR